MPVPFRFPKQTHPFSLYRLNPTDHTPNSDLQRRTRQARHQTKTHPTVVILELRLALEDHTVARASAVLVINAADSRQGAASLQNDERTTRKTNRRARQRLRARLCVYVSSSRAAWLTFSEILKRRG